MSNTTPGIDDSKIKKDVHDRGIRAVGIVVNDGNILLIRREHSGRGYYTFPGGGVEVGESVRAAVVRELMEEASISVEVARVLYYHDLIEDSEHYFFECTFQSGEVALNGEELLATMAGDIHEPLWFPITQLPTITLYPLEVRDWLIEDLVHGFPLQPRVLRMRPEQLRS